MVSLDSKRGELKEFHKLLSDLKSHKPVTLETKNRKIKIMSNVNQLYYEYFDTYHKKWQYLGFKGRR